MNTTRTMRQRDLARSARLQRARGNPEAAAMFDQLLADELPDCPCGKHILGDPCSHGWMLIGEVAVRQAPAI